MILLASATVKLHERRRALKSANLTGDAPTCPSSVNAPASTLHCDYNTRLMPDACFPALCVQRVNRLKLYEKDSFVV